MKPWCDRLTGKTRVSNCALDLRFLSCETEFKAAEDPAGWKSYTAMPSQRPTVLRDVTSLHMFLYRGTCQPSKILPCV